MYVLYGFLNMTLARLKLTVWGNICRYNKSWDFACQLCPTAVQQIAHSSWQDGLQKYPDRKRDFPLYVLSLWSRSQSTYNTHTEWQRPLSDVHSILIEKLAQAGEGGGCTPAPLALFTITYKVALYAPAQRTDTLTLFRTLWSPISI
jgi:hypothetical protein